MNLYEELKDQDAKKKFRELVKKYHPDTGGDSETIKKINNAKDLGDKALLDLYNELLKKPEKSTQEKTILNDLKSEIKRRKPVKDQNLDDIIKGRYSKSKFDKKLKKKMKYSQNVRDILKNR